MKIAIIGATKGIGKEIFNQATEQHFEVKVLARDKTKINNKNAEVIEGDFIDFDAIKSTIKNVDVVIISVGVPPSFKPVDLFSKGTQNVINATKNLNTNPLIIAVTGIGAGNSKGHGGFFYDKIINPLLLKTIYQDKNKQEQILKDQYDKWIIVRPGFLNNASKTGQYKVLINLKGVTAGKISRADVADFILKQVQNPTSLKQTPLITY